MTLSVRQLSKGHVVSDVTKWLSSRFEREREGERERSPGPSGFGRLESF